MSLTKIKLHGHLGVEFGKEFQFHIDTVSECINALSVNLKGFQQYLITHSEPGYRVVIDDNPVMDITELSLCVNKPKIIHIIPVIAGSDGKGIGQILVGVVLVALAFVTAGQSLWGFVVTESMAFSIGAMGAGMIFTGASSLMSPTPTASNQSKQSDNKSFSNSRNTIAQGFRVPIGYGKIQATGYPISVKLVIEDGK